MLTSCRVVLKVSFKKIRKKENSENYKHDKQLDQNNQPNLPSPPGKIGKPITVKAKYLSQKFHIT